MFDLKTWDGFSELPKQNLDYLLDTTALNKKMAEKKENPYRWKIGSFQVPKGISEENKKRASKVACDKFIQAMSKQGWELKSKVQVYGPFPALDLLSQVILLDMEEIRIRGIFATKPEPVRIEIPKGMVRQYPSQESSAVDVMKAAGMSVARREKIKV